MPEFVVILRRVTIFPNHVLKSHFTKQRMKHSLLIIFSLLNLHLFAQKYELTQAQVDSLDRLRIAYIAQYKGYAMDEMVRSGIPASITVAQGILETAAGTSVLCLTANNHFGMKCGKSWYGDTFFKNDDEYDANGQIQRSCFRAYSNAGDNFADHSMFLHDPQKSNRYGFLFNFAPTDYVSWAKGLQLSGYSPVGHYSARLVEFVERYRLHEIDANVVNQSNMSMNVDIATSRLVTINQTSAVYANAGETVAQLAHLYFVDARSLLDYNEQRYDLETPLPQGAAIFMGPKSASWLGDSEFHYAALGQTMEDIAHIYGIRVADLRRRNALSPGQEPMFGAKVRLKGVQEAEEFVKLRTRRVDKPTAKSPEDLPMLVSIPPLYPLNYENSAALRDALLFTSKSTAAAVYRYKPVVVQTQPEAVVIPIPSEEPAFHRVSSGETLTGIARKYALSVSRIQQLNELSGNLIREGQLLRVK